MIDLMIAISLSAKQLCVVENQVHEVECFDIAIGKQSTPTPLGSFNIVGIVDYPSYVDINGVNRGRGVLGDLAIVTDVDTVQGLGLAIHGTNAPHLIGQAVSGGCVRMSNKDMKTLDHLYLNKISYGVITN